MTARTYLLALVLLPLLAVPARADESSVWWEMQNGLASAKRDPSFKKTGGVRPEYLRGYLEKCATLGKTRRAEPQVAADKVAAARELCVLATQTFVRRCVDAANGDCPSVDGAALTDGIQTLAPLTQAERVLLDKIPDPFWVGLDKEMLRELQPQNVNTAVERCLDAPKHNGSAKSRETGRNYCVRAATTFAKYCIAQSARPMRCFGRWDRWEAARDAAAALGTLSPEQSAAFDRIIKSPELADVRMTEKYNAIVDELEAKKIDRCGMIGKLRELLGPPTPALVARVEAAKEDKSFTNELSRLSSYLFHVHQMYLGAKRGLDTPVEYANLDAAKQAVVSLTCIKDYSDAAALLEKATAQVTAIEEYQAKEAACMADAKCKAQRIAGQICSAMQARRDVEKDIHKEWRLGREAGVVSLKRLGDDKDALESLDDEIAAAKLEYKAVAKREFSTGACPKAKKASKTK